MLLIKPAGARAGAAGPGDKSRRRARPRAASLHQGQPGPTTPILTGNPNGSPQEDSQSAPATGADQQDFEPAAPVAGADPHAGCSLCPPWDLSAPVPGAKPIFGCTPRLPAATGRTPLRRRARPRAPRTLGLDPGATLCPPDLMHDPAHRRSRTHPGPTSPLRQRRTPPSGAATSNGRSSGSFGARWSPLETPRRRRPTHGRKCRPTHAASRAASLRRVRC